MDWICRRIFLVLTFFLFVPNLAVAAPQANEVVVFEHAHFIGQSTTYRLEPEQRHVIIHDLGEFSGNISSLQTGKDVSVVLCLNPPAEYQAITEPLAPLSGRIETLQKDNWATALLIYRTAQGLPAHIVLESIGEKSSGLLTVYTPGRYYYFEPGKEGQNTLEIGRLPEHTNDNFDRLELFNGKLGKVQVTLYPHPQFMGNPLGFPGAGSSANVFPLWDYGLGDQVSSLIISFEPAPIVGGAIASMPHLEMIQAQEVLMEAKAVPPVPPPPTAPDPASPQTPPAPEPPDTTVPTMTPQIHGSWSSSIHLDYEISQKGEKISWFLPLALQKAEGTISEDEVTVTWVDLQGKGGNSGIITKKDNNGRALEIQWKDGVVFFRKK